MINESGHVRVLFSLLKCTFCFTTFQITEVNKLPATAATNFKNSMQQLVTLLLSKDPYYVRCIKPNANKAPNQLDETLTRHQVRYLGLIENLRVRRAGYCNRQVYDHFVQRYKVCGTSFYNLRFDYTPIMFLFDLLRKIARFVRVNGANLRLL